MTEADDLKNWCHEALLARAAALEAARDALGKGEVESVGSIRRIANSIRSLCAQCGFCEITDAAQALALADDAAMPDRLGRILAMLHTVDGIPEDRRKSILAVDSDPNVLAALRERLTSSGRRIVTADSAARAGEILASSNIQLILLGMFLPDIDARDLLVRLKEESATSGIPVLILSDSAHRRTRLECLALGAEDVLTKPLDLEHLATVVSARLQRADEISRGSLYDPLTRVPSRGAFIEAFQRAQSHAARTREPVSVAMLDLDHLQLINESYGRSVGNGVIRRFSAVVSQGLRKSDLLARWGWEGFVVLFPDTDGKGAARALEKALEHLRKGTFQSRDGGKFKATFSAGVTPVRAGDRVEDVVREAIRLMNAAKGAGRDRVIFSDEGTALQVKKVLLVEDDPIVASVLQHRLEREGFEVSTYTEGIVALDSCKKAAPDLIILDVEIRGMDGLELLSRFRGHPFLRKVPIVLLAGLGSEGTVSRALELGANDAITKPFSPVELVARIRRQMTRG
ncbi:MAG: response regulator [Nitrospirae bacterium]|nr:response regulator [Nitrospirota bacterium]